MEDFIVMNSAKHPELLNYMGFAEMLDIQDIKGREPLYEEHMSFEDMVIGIKEGKYFKGMLMIDRVNPEEAKVKVEGFKDDVLIMGLKN